MYIPSHSHHFKEYGAIANVGSLLPALCWSIAHHLPPATTEQQTVILYVSSVHWLLKSGDSGFALQAVTPAVTGPHSGSGRLKVSSSDLGWTRPSQAQLYFLLMETKPLIGSSVWSQFNPNLRSVPPFIIPDQTSLPTLPESNQPSGASFTCEGINDSGQEIPHLILIKFFFQNLHAWLSSNKSGVLMFDPPLHWCNQWKECTNALYNKETKTPQ